MLAISSATAATDARRDDRSAAIARLQASATTASIGDDGMAALAVPRRFQPRLATAFDDAADHGLEEHDRIAPRSLAGGLLPPLIAVLALIGVAAFVLTAFG